MFAILKPTHRVGFIFLKMQTTKRAQYALRAMIILAKEEDICSLRSIAKREGISLDYLEKVFSFLEKGDLVKAKRGAGGGYLLFRNAEEITLKDIFRAVKEPVLSIDCLSGKRCPHDGSCSAIRAWKEVREKIKKTLSSIKLSDLAE